MLRCSLSKDNAKIMQEYKYTSLFNKKLTVLKLKKSFHLLVLSFFPHKICVL